MNISGVVNQICSTVEQRGDFLCVTGVEGFDEILCNLANCLLVGAGWGCRCGFLAADESGAEMAIEAARIVKAMRDMNSPLICRCTDWMVKLSICRPASRLSVV